MKTISANTFASRTDFGEILVRFIAKEFRYKPKKNKMPTQNRGRKKNPKKCE